MRMKEENRNLRLALEDMLARYELYCGGPDAPYGGHTDKALMERCRHVLNNGEIKKTEKKNTDAVVNLNVGIIEWKDLEKEPPSGEEYAVILFPVKTDCGLFYTLSNPEYARKNGIKSGYTHWARLSLAPGHSAMEEWRDNLTPEEIETSLDSASDYLHRLDKEQKKANVWKKNSQRLAKEFWNEGKFTRAKLKEKMKRMGLIK